MNVEEQVTTALHHGLERLEVSAGDLGAALEDGRRIRRRRTRLRVAAAVAVTAVVATAVGLVFRPGELSRVPAPDPTPAPAGHWTELPRPPLSPRISGIAVWTGVEAVFLGGEVGNHCPPTAGCTKPSLLASDGAAYNPKTGTWRAIEDAPVTVASWTPHAVVGDVLVIVGDDRTWHAYDASEDAWRSLPVPPARPETHGSSLTAYDGSVVTLARNDTVMLLDVATGEWRTLPSSSHQPRLRLHAALATGEGVVALGTDSTQPDDGTVPGFIHAEVFRDGSWTRLERSDMVGGYTWHWTGDRLVSPDPSCVDGGETNGYGRCIPEGGILDPESGAWEPLPEGPALTGNGWSLTGSGGDWVLAGDHLYDDGDESWTRLGTPEGAEGYGDTTAVVADGRVIAFGGIDWSRGFDAPDLVTDRTWMWTP